MYVWEMNRRTLVSEHHDVEKKPLACITGSSLLPIIFFSRVSSRDVSGTFIYFYTSSFKMILVLF